MKILVCVKQVPESDTPVILTDDGPWVTEAAAYRMNRLDEYAMEYALRLKEAHPETTVDVVSLGPERVREAIRRALAMGAQAGFHLLDDTQGYHSPADTAGALAAFAAPRSYDLILAGVMAEDDMQCQVGPLMAAGLEIPCAVSVTHLTLDADGRQLTVESEMEGGLSQTIALQLPALVTVQSGGDRPRYPSLSNMLRARSQEVPVVAAGDLYPLRHYDILTGLAFPEKSDCKVLSGSPQEKADALLRILAEKGVLN